MTPRPTPVATIDPAALHLALNWAHHRAADHLHRFTIQRVADRMRVAAPDIGRTLDVLAALGLLAADRTRHNTTIYRLAALPELRTAACRPASGISARELWVAVVGTGSKAPDATTDEIAERLDVPAGMVDRTWLALRLATFAAAGRLGLTHEQRWSVTRLGLDYARGIRQAPLTDREMWAAIATEQPSMRHPVHPAVLAWRLGLETDLVDVWVYRATREGLLTRLEGGVLLITDTGRAQLGEQPVP
ncbi:hypothetical protein MXD59_12650 [Frankia sp. Ag45/Mut15]|uniref:Uncharacterized protein n=1 Tax=Frankia umida TaxID=573489 RepID=A0ABT0JYJ5_9ACTN|nr:hypothetical protein [Frankia umida]MCK9876617.1 hypothetical protein [Frankia umida]